MAPSASARLMSSWRSELEDLHLVAGHPRQLVEVDLPLLGQVGGAEEAVEPVTQLLEGHLGLDVHEDGEVWADGAAEAASAGTRLENVQVLPEPVVPLERRVGDRREREVLAEDDLAGLHLVADDRADTGARREREEEVGLEDAVVPARVEIPGAHELRAPAVRAVDLVALPPLGGERLAQLVHQPHHEPAGPVDPLDDDQLAALHCVAPVCRSPPTTVGAAAGTYRSQGGDSSRRSASRAAATISDGGPWIRGPAISTAPTRAG